MVSHSWLMLVYPFIFGPMPFQTSVQSINYMIGKVIKNLCPFELLYNKSPKYKDLRIFGCAAYPWLRPYNKHKYSIQTNQCLYLIHSPTHHGHLCLDIAKDRIYIA